MISVKEATKNYINGGKGKTTMPLGRMFVLAFLAGMFIALRNSLGPLASNRFETADRSHTLSFVKNMFSLPVQDSVYSAYSF